MVGIFFLIIILSVWGLVLIFISFTDDYTTFSIFACPFIISLFFLEPISQVVVAISPSIGEFLQVLAFLVGIVIVWQFFNLVWR